MEVFCMGSAVSHNKGVLLPVDIAAPEDPEIAGCVYAFTSQSYMLILVSFEHKDKNMSKRRPVTATAMLCWRHMKVVTLNKHNSHEAT